MWSILKLYCKGPPPGPSEDLKDKICEVYLNTDREYWLFYFLQMVPLDFAKKMKYWSRRGFPELGDIGGMGIGSTTRRVLHHPDFLNDPHKVQMNNHEIVRKLPWPE